MYLKKIIKHLKIMEEIGNLLIKDQITNLSIKGISNVINMEKKDTSN